MNLKNFFQNIFINIFFFLGVFLFLLGKWIYENFGICSLEQIIFHLLSPQIKHEMIKFSYTQSFHRLVLIPTIFIFLLFFVIINIHNIKHFNSLIKKLGKYKIFSMLFSFFLILKNNSGKVSLIFIVCGLIEFSHTVTGIDLLIKSLLSKKKAYSVYLTPYSNITFPNKKYNLVFIFLESIEQTFQNKDIFKKNLIPNLTEIQNKNYSFNNHQQVFGTGWTMGALVSYLCGTPMRSVNYKNDDTFLAKTLCLTDVLKRNGYNLKSIRGADNGFANFHLFANKHGLSNNIIGYSEIRKSEQDWEDFMKPEWGISDKKTIAITKREILELANKKNPFALFYLTSDTHFPFGYLDPSCQGTKKEYVDVLACADKMNSELITWIQNQEFSKDTLIVIVSDHLFMGGPIANKYLKDHSQDRRNLNIFINPIKPLKTQNRVITHFDFFPTILEALGASLGNERLYLGTSLFSNQPTLIEELGDRKLNEVLFHDSHTPERDYYYLRKIGQKDNTISNKIINYIVKVLSLDTEY